MKKFLVLIVLILTITLFGQEPSTPEGDPFQYNHFEKFYPKAPGASSFEKFVNIPQGNYTGIHGYSVPIYSIGIKDSGFPISINYHGMGVNVNERSGNVGMGWSLSVGGINLSQEIRGYDDGDPQTLRIDLEKGTDFLSGNVDPEFGDPEQYANARKVSGIYTSTLTGNESAADRFEFSPDHFSYSLLNNSGKFIIDGAGNFQTIPKDDVEISGNINNLVIKDNQGIQYTFSRYEHSESITGPGPRPKSYSYKLESVYFPQTKKTMSFTYVGTEDYEYISNYETWVNVVLDVTAGGNATVINPQPSFTTHTTVTEELLVKTITYEDTFVDFTYSANIEGGKKLDRIEVYFKPLTGSMQKIKDFALNNRNLSGRLRLDSITDQIANTSYTFDYEDTKAIPAQFSAYTDWWGSYTKPKENNYTHIPSFIYYEYAGGPRKFFDGANKEPDLEYAVTGALKRIHFPTGGYQEFHYELDDYKFHDSEIEYEAQWFNFESDWVETNPNQQLTLPIGDPDFREGLDYRLTFYWGATHESCNPGNEIPIGRFFKFQLYRDNDIPVGTNQVIEAGTVYQIDESDIIPGSTYYLKITANGSYNTQCPDPDPNGSVIITPQINYIHESEPIYKKNKNAGHLRVGAITLHDSDGTLKIKRRFEYKSFADPSFSSGVYLGIPLHRKPVVRKPIAGGLGSCPYSGGYTITTEKISNNPSLNLNSSYGKSVFYENVTEIYEDLITPANSYRKELVFQLPNQEGYPEDKDPYVYWPHNEYTGGQLLEERMYDNTFNPNISDNTPSLVKRIINDPAVLDFHFNYESSFYDLAIPNAIGFGVAASFERKKGSHFPMYHHYFIDTNVYYITSAWVKRLKTVEEDYKNGVLWMTNTTEYQYSPTYSHLNPVSVTTTNSLGQVVKTEYDYNHLFKKTEPTTIRKYENGVEQSVQETKFYSPAGFPQYVFAKRAASTLDNVPPSEDLKVTYNSYDAKGNPTQYTLENGTPVSIIWGYNGQYPIAKIEGLPYTSIPAGHITDVVNASNADLDASTENTLRTELQQLREDGALANLMVTTYTYNPLIGVTSITSPGGQVEYYIYDTAGRLQKVVDHEQKEIRKMDYNYQQP